MPADLHAVLKLEVPIIVLLGGRSMTVGDVLTLRPGAIIELPTQVDDELTLQVNNKGIGAGVVLKVGENFGLRVTYVGDLKNGIRALSGERDNSEEMEDARLLAEALTP